MPQSRDHVLFPIFSLALTEEKEVFLLAGNGKQVQKSARETTRTGRGGGGNGGKGLYSKSTTMTNYVATF